jgi:23S rRNA pseudouridine2605 synthase
MTESDADITKSPDAAPPREGERIAKRLARAGLCSRRDAERWIAEGRVSVDGQKLTSPAVNVTERSRITVDGQPIPEKTPTRLWRYHKPRGLLTTHRDPEGRRTIFDELPAELPRVITIGRLDLNSEGLLLLTNDGELARKLELPATGWIRRYRVRVNGQVDPQALAGLAKGVTIEGVHYGAVKAQLDRQQGDNAWLTMSLTEGKNREVRRICEHLGWRVNRLIRIAYGPFQLGLLEPGGVEEVSARVVKEQMGIAGGGAATAAEKRRQREKAHDEKRRQKREEKRAQEQRERPAQEKKPARPGKREREAKWKKPGAFPSPGKPGFARTGAGFETAGKRGDLPAPTRTGHGKARKPFEPRDRDRRGKRGDRRLEKIEETFETREARSFVARDERRKGAAAKPERAFAKPERRSDDQRGKPASRDERKKSGAAKPERPFVKHEKRSDLPSPAKSGSRKAGAGFAESGRPAPRDGGAKRPNGDRRGKPDRRSKPGSGHAHRRRPS